MSRVAIIPLTANPFHEGHWDIGRKAARGFDKIIFALGFNPDKDDISKEALESRCKEAKDSWHRINDLANLEYKVDADKVIFDYFVGFLVDYANGIGADAIVRGIRGVDDIGYEMKQQFWNEDLGLKTPTFLVMADRGLQHISSSAIRQVRKARQGGSEHYPTMPKPLFTH